MDNLTHSLIGLAAAKAGLERLSPGATALCVIAANIPDGDVVTLPVGRWFYLEHHRGITHSVVGALALALILPIVFLLVDKLIAYIRKRPPSVKLRGLIVASLLVTATHPFMDWTNNYGVRPLLPWSSKWFYGDFVFIIDPFLWLTLAGGVFLVTSKSKKQVGAWLLIAIIPTYLVLIGPANRFMGGATIIRVLWFIALVTFVVLYMRDAGKSWGARIPQVALAVAGVYLAGLFLVHAVALRQARLEGQRIASSNGESALDIAAMPTAANPFQWLCVVETDKAAYKFNLSVLTGNGSAPVRHARVESSDSPAIRTATTDDRSRAFLGFARFPVVKVIGEDCATQTLVQFADLRYTEPGSDRGTFSLEVPVACPPQD